MFRIKNDGTKVQVLIEAGVNVAKRWFTFTYDTQDEVYAELLATSFQKFLENKLESARRDAYNKGWIDAKHHMKKETWFSRYF